MKTKNPLLLPRTRKSLLRSFTVSVLWIHLAVLMIALLSGFFILLAISRRQTIREAEDRLAYMTYQMDNLIGSLSDMRSQLLQDKDMRSYLTTSRSYDVDDILLQRSVMNQLSIIISSCNYINSITVFHGDGPVLCVSKNMQIQGRTEDAPLPVQQSENWESITSTSGVTWGGQYQEMELFLTRYRQKEAGSTVVSYTDSVMGEMSWALTEASVEELNRVLRAYGILSAEEISQFLAQAMVETVGGRWLLEIGDDPYFQDHGYTAGTRGAGYFHLTFAYGQMAFATWMMKCHVPELAEIEYVNPTFHGRETIREGYYRALGLAANLGLDVSAYSRIVYDAHSPVPTGAEYIAASFAWESAGYYWHITGISAALDGEPGTHNTDAVSQLVGGGNWQSRREAYLAISPVLYEQS